LSSNEKTGSGPNPEGVERRALAANDLLPQLYDQLRQLATARLAKLPAGQTLQATALVHEAFLRLTSKGDPGWDTPGHFFGAAAIAMRRVLVDHARARLADKRGGSRKRVEIDSSDLSFDAASEDVVMLDELLTEFEKHHPRQGQMVAMRFFAGLTEEQIATALEISDKTVQRDWRFARAWLLSRWGAMDGNAPAGSAS
jgi:RNA polymerase sigma factor (TIGR02999 family)